MFKNILVAVDGSKHSDKGIETACNIGAKYNAKLYIVHVVQDIKVPEGVLKYMKGEEIIDKPAYVYLQLIGERIMGHSEKIAKQCGFINIETAILRGNPADKIIEFAREKNVDLIILGSHGLGNIAGLVMGSVSRKVCHLADRTCITVR